jgi:hypothetical protein
MHIGQIIGYEIVLVDSPLAQLDQSVLRKFLPNQRFANFLNPAKMEKCEMIVIEM